MSRLPRRRATWPQVVVLTCYSAFSVAGVVVIAADARPELWERGGAVALLMSLAVLGALIMRRRWAWWTLLALDCATVLLGVAEHRVGIAWSGYVLAPLLLLLSPPMRAYVGVRGRASRHVAIVGRPDRRDEP